MKKHRKKNAEAEEELERQIEASKLRRLENREQRF
jgi:hypothetical protein